MTETEIKLEIRKQRRLEKLGSNTPRCGTCGESRWPCLENHHPAGRKFDPKTVVVECRNCHRIVSDYQKDYPKFDPDADSMLQAIGQFLLGLAELLRLAVEKLAEYGNALIVRAASDGGEARP